QARPRIAGGARRVALAVVLVDDVIADDAVLVLHHRTATAHRNRRRRIGVGFGLIADGRPGDDAEAGSRSAAETAAELVADDAADDRADQGAGARRLLLDDALAVGTSLSLHGDRAGYRRRGNHLRVLGGAGDARAAQQGSRGSGTGADLHRVHVAQL